MFNDNHAPRQRKFDVYKRERNGFTHKIGVVQATSKHHADTRVRYLYGKQQLDGEAFWAIDPEREVA